MDSLLWVTSVNEILAVLNVIACVLFVPTFVLVSRRKSLVVGLVLVLVSSMCLQSALTRFLKF